MKKPSPLFASIGRYVFKAAVFLLLLPDCGWSESAHDCPKKAVIGVIVPLSAGAVSSGQAVKHSVELASEKYDPHRCVRFVFEDDQMVPKNTVTALNKLVSVDKVSGVIIYGTPTSLAVGDQVERLELPMIALSILAKVVEGRRYIVKHWCTAEKLNAALLAEVERRGHKKVAVVSMINEAMLGLRDLYRSTAAQPPVLDSEFARDNTDFGAAAMQIAAQKPDGVYVLLFPPQVAPFMKRLRGAGYRGEAFGVHNIEDPSEIRAAQGAMDGMWLANGDGDAGEGYFRTYLERFGTEPALGGASGFDSAKLFIEAVGSGDVNGFLHTIRNFSGAYGVYNSSGHSDFDFDAVIKTISGDKISVMQR